MGGNGSIKWSFHKVPQKKILSITYDNNWVYVLFFWVSIFVTYLFYKLTKRISEFFTEIVKVAIGAEILGLIVIAPYDCQLVSMESLAVASVFVAIFIIENGKTLAKEAKRLRNIVVNIARALVKIKTNLRTKRELTCSTLSNDLCC